MNSKALSEVYSIINIMNPNVIKKIPSNFYDFIKINRDPLYKPEFKKLPQNFDNLEHDTKVILALIYKKYFLNDLENNLNIYIKMEENKSVPEINKLENKSLVIYKKSLKEKIIEFLKKLKKN